MPDTKSKLSLFKCDTTNNVIRVIAENSECSRINVITVENFGSSSMRAVPITGYTLELSTNHQFLHSLDEFIYAFAFGDRVGELTVTGVVFTSRPCNEQQRSIADEVGQKNVYEYYLQNRFSKTQRSTKILIGESNVKLIGFLTGVRLEVPNPALPIAQWALRFSVIVAPSPASNSTGGGGGAWTPPLSTPQVSTPRISVPPATGISTVPGSGGGGGFIVTRDNDGITVQSGF